MAFSIPGVVLSSLIFDMKNSQGDKVGLLLGETLRYNVSAISDSESCGTREERKICVQEYVLTDHIYSFCDRRGRIEFNKLDKIVNGRLKNIVGWFRYRCNSTHQLSLMEKTVHRYLMQGLPHTPDKDFVFGLFTEQTPDDPGLHALDHSFSQWIGSSPQLVHVDIVNLKSTSTMPYRFSPIAPIPSSVDSYHDVFDQDTRLLGNDSDTTHSLAMDELFSNLQRKFDPLQVELRKSYSTIETLANDINGIQKKLHHLKTVEVKPQTQEETKDEDVAPLISFNDDDDLPSLAEISMNHHSDDKLSNGVDCSNVCVVPKATIPDLITDIRTDGNDDDDDDDEDTISV